MGELLPILGISRASFFSYRSGKRPITAKAWRKLEQAERAAGVVTLKEQLATKPDDERAAELIRGASVEDVMSLLPAEERTRIAQKIFNSHLAKVKRDLHGFFLNLEGLIAVLQGGMKTIGGADKKLGSDAKYFVSQLQRDAETLRPMLDAVLTVAGSIADD